MAELAGCSLSAAMKLAVDHNAGPDPGAHDHDDEVVDPVAETEHCSVAVRVLASFSRMTGSPVFARWAGPGPRCAS